MLNDQIVGARGEDIELDIRGVERLRTHTDSIAPEAACTSLQFHLQVAPDSFADYWNASQAIAGVAGRGRGQLARSCSAGGCGPRPGSRCSSRPPTPGRTS